MMRDTTALIERPFHLLMIEDNHGDVVLVEEALRHHPRLSVHVVENTVEACRFLKKQDDFAHAPVPDLILLDLNLPVFSGILFLTARQIVPEWFKIPVVVFTSSALESDRERCLALGANDYLTKPREWNDWIMLLETKVDLYGKSE
jgi:two-component system response regulator